MGLVRVSTGSVSAIVSPIFSPPFISGRSGSARSSKLITSKDLHFHFLLEKNVAHPSLRLSATPSALSV